MGKNDNIEICDINIKIFFGKLALGVINGRKCLVLALGLVIGNGFRYQILGLLGRSLFLSK